MIGKHVRIVNDPDLEGKGGVVRHMKGDHVYVELDDSKDADGVPEQVKLRAGQVEQPEESPLEFVICAAVMANNGVPFRCHRHNHGFMAISMSALAPAEGGEAAQGFITSKGRFVSRQEARELQERAGIGSVVGYKADGKLYSEDLY